MALAEPRAKPDVHKVRSYFPSLQSGFAYLENAGGSQVPGMVADAIRDYMLTTYVQTGAGYPQSYVATETVEKAHAFTNRFMGGEGIGQAILGHSSTALIHILANSCAFAMAPGTRIISGEPGHEANIGPWAMLGQRGFDFQVWCLDPESMQCSLEELERLLKEAPTKIATFPHVSNLLGEIIDIRPIVELCHRYGARVVVDGVAYAPHRAIDVKAWDVDWYVFSCYKVYGPHMAALFGKQEALNEIEGPNHFFVPRDLPYKFELGGIMHESCAGWLAVGRYLNVLAGKPENTETTRQTVVEAFDTIKELELPLQKRFIDYLNSKPGVKVVGPNRTDASRVCTISFVHERLTPPEIVAHVHQYPIGIRYGNAYAYRLCQALGIEPETGVVRASFAHYNTILEIDRLIKALDEIL